MALCPDCGKEMHEAAGCDYNYISFDNGKIKYARIPYKDVNDLHPEVSNERCHDCGVLAGGIHHFGCDMERCSKCGFQLLSCCCSDDGEVMLYCE